MLLDDDATGISAVWTVGANFIRRQLIRKFRYILEHQKPISPTLSVNRNPIYSICSLPVVILEKDRG